MATRMRLTKIKRGYRGHRDEYQYGDRLFHTFRDNERFYVYEGHEQVYYGERFEGYRQFMKAFRLFLAKSEQK